MECKATAWTVHAERRLFQRNVSAAAVIPVITSGEAIEAYPNDVPFPSVLILGAVDGHPLHVVVARVPQTLHCIVVTVYWPDRDFGDADFRRRTQR